MLITSKLPIKDVISCLTSTTIDIHFLIMNISFSSAVVMVPITRLTVTAMLHCQRTTDSQRFLNTCQSTQVIWQLNLIYTYSLQFHYTQYQIFVDQILYTYYLYNIFLMDRSTLGKNHGKPQRHQQVQVQRQELIVAQNYANNIIFMTLSTVETIKLKVKGIKDWNYKKDKLFGKYDTLDFSHKDVGQLIVQLHGQIMCLRASMQCYEYQYKGQFKYPKDFDEQKIKHFLRDAAKFFGSIQSRAGLEMLDLIRDIQHILFEQNISKLNIETKLYGHTDKKANGQFMQNNALIAEDVRAEKQKVESKGYQKLQDIETKVNQNTQIGKYWEKQSEKQFEKQFKK